MRRLATRVWDEAAGTTGALTGLIAAVAFLLFGFEHPMIALVVLVASFIAMDRLPESVFWDAAQTVYGVCTLLALVILWVDAILALLAN